MIKHNLVSSWIHASDMQSNGRCLMYVSMELCIKFFYSFKFSASHTHVLNEPIWISHGTNTFKKGKKWPIKTPGIGK